MSRRTKRLIVIFLFALVCSSIALAQPSEHEMLIVVILLLVVLRIALSIRVDNQAERKTKEWSVENGWKLEEFKRTWTFQRGRSNYRFVVTDKEGVRKTGMVRYRERISGVHDPIIEWLD
jgi:hypothetical protein